MRRLFVIVLSSFLVSLLLFIAVMSATFFLGYRRSVAGWGREKLRSAEEELVSALEEILPLLEHEGKSAEAAALLGESVGKTVPPGLVVTVYDRFKRPLFDLGYAHPMRGMRMMHGARGMGMGRGSGPGMGRSIEPGPGIDPSSPPLEPGPGAERGRGIWAVQLPLKPVLSGDRILGYYRIGIPDFGADRADARFLGSMRRTVWIGIAFASVLAFFFAFFLSRRLGRSAMRVSDGIERMAAGNLSVKIPEDGAEEIVVIARAANELARKLGREEAIRKQWAADVAHDLRTPIAAVRAQLEGMRDGVLSLTGERVGKNLDEILRIESLVDDLAELTRLESPEMKLRTVAVSAERCCRDLEARFERDFRAKGIAAEWGCGALTLFADEGLLLRAISNFITNAVRHTPEGGRIRVSFEEAAGGFAVRVFNTGEAIPKEEVERIFQRLYRGERSRGTPGAGLGLTISLKIAELHGGTVKVESEDGRGTTLIMTLPRVPPG
jgi:two-component system sensor histidine kinase BaeS